MKTLEQIDFVIRGAMVEELPFIYERIVRYCKRSREVGYEKYTLYAYNFYDRKRRMRVYTHEDGSIRIRMTDAE